MIDEQLWAEARRLFHVEHLSKSEIPRSPAEVSVPHRPAVADTHVLPHRLEVYDHDDADS